MLETTSTSSSLIAAPELRPTSSRRHDAQKSAPLRSIPSHQDSPGTHSLNLFTRAAFAEEESKRRKTSMYHQEERQDYRTTQAWSLESASLYLPTLHQDDPRMQDCQMDDSCSSSPELSRSPDSLGNSTDEEYDEAGDSSSDSSAPARSRRVIPLPAPLAASRYIKQLPRPFVRMMDPPRVRQRLYVAMAMETDSGKTNSTWPLEQERENGGWAGRGEVGAGLRVEDLPLNSLGLF